PNVTLFPYTTLFRSSARSASIKNSMRGSVGVSFIGQAPCGSLVDNVYFDYQEYKRPIAMRVFDLEIDDANEDELWGHRVTPDERSEEHTSELQSLAY